MIIKKKSVSYTNNDYWLVYNYHTKITLIRLLNNNFQGIFKDYFNQKICVKSFENKQICLYNIDQFYSYYELDFKEFKLYSTDYIIDNKYNVSRNFNTWIINYNQNYLNTYNQSFAKPARIDCNKTLKKSLELFQNKYERQI